MPLENASSLLRRRGDMVTLLAGAAVTAALLNFAPLSNLRGPAVVHFLTYFMIMAVAYLAAAIFVSSKRNGDELPSLWLLWGFAIVFRLILLFSAPSLSDDVYRYMWDGHLLGQFINPYALPVEAPALDAYAVPARAMVNHSWMASPYLPVAQLVFLAVVRLAPGSPLAFQTAGAFFDLATAWLVMDLLRRLGLPKQRVLLYLWNPLVVVEFAHGAHIDAWMIFLVALAFWLLARAEQAGKRQTIWLNSSALALAAATLTKGIPMIFLPLFVRRWGARRLALYALAVLIPLVVFSFGAGWGLSGELDGVGIFGALRIYARQWNFNGSLYHWLETGLTGYSSPGAVPIEPDYLAGIALAKWISAGALGLALLATTWIAWWDGDPEDPKGLVGSIFQWLGRPDRDVEQAKPALKPLGYGVLNLLRLATLPAGAYLLLAPTVHPWYAVIVLPWLPFLLLADGENSHRGRFVWPWLYLSCALVFSYLTYIDLAKFQEYALVRRLEYGPFFALMAWAAWPYIKRAMRFGAARGPARRLRVSRSD